MPQHVRMDRERHLGAPPDPAEKRVKGAAWLVLL
jgi:hypothetical protein